MDFSAQLHNRRFQFVREGRWGEHVYRVLNCNSDGASICVFSFWLYRGAYNFACWNQALALRSRLRSLNIAGKEHRNRRRRCLFCHHIAALSLLRASLDISYLLGFPILKFGDYLPAFLDYYDVPYKVVEVNPFSKKEIKWFEYKKVPILMVDGEALVDSSAIIDQMGTKIIPVKASSAVSNDDEEKKWSGFYLSSLSSG